MEVRELLSQSTTSPGDDIPIVKGLGAEGAMEGQGEDRRAQI